MSFRSIFPRLISHVAAATLLLREKICPWKSYPNLTQSISFKFLHPSFYSGLLRQIATAILLGVPSKLPEFIPSKFQRNKFKQLLK